MSFIKKKKKKKSMKMQLHELRIQMYGIGSHKVDSRNSSILHAIPKCINCLFGPAAQPRLHSFFYYFKLIFFSVFKLFWCIGIKNKILKIKNIILIYFWTKNILKITTIILSSTSTTLSIVKLAFSQFLLFWKNYFSFDTKKKEGKKVKIN